MARRAIVILCLCVGCGEAADPDAGRLDTDGDVAVLDAAEPADGGRDGLDAGPADDAGASAIDASAPDGGGASDGGASDGGASDGGAGDAGADAGACAADDERACYGGPADTIDVGVCQAGVERCAGGAWGACEGATLPSAEICDGLDDDCDTRIDEELMAPPASTQAGVCAGAVQVCGGAAGFVDPDFSTIDGYETDELGACDGVDNDCDGATDEAHDVDGDGYYAITDPACATRYRTTARWDCDDDDPTRHACVVYVDRDATGAGDGTSWANAYVALRDALAAATAPMEVWIAEGTYRPDEGAGVSPGARDASFTPSLNVAIFGGFAGTEIARDQRDPRAHASVLSGDLNDDDAAGFANRVDNSDHVVTVRNGVILDGLTIRGGAARDGVAVGAGIYANQARTLLLRDLVVEENVALGNGGGLWLDRSDAQIIGATFRANRAYLQGSAIHLASSSAVAIYNSVFAANTNIAERSQIAAEDGAVRVFSSSFAGYNVAPAIRLDFGASAEVQNSVLWQSGYSGGFGTDFLTPGNCELFSSSAPSPFVDVDGPDGVRGNEDDDLRLRAGSGCVDAGDPTQVPPFLTTDIAGRPRVFGAAVDNGAHEARWMNGCEADEVCPERCDGVDDDGDGAIDEDPSDMPPCLLAGVCSTHVAVCSGGSWSCSYPSASYMSAETNCGDRIDNDCDTIVDEPFACVCTPGEDLGQACDGGADHDRCATGALMCDGAGAPTCVGDDGYHVSAYVNTGGGYGLDRETPGCAGGTELHVFSIYTPYAPSGDPTPTRVDVEVQRTGAPYTLIVASADPADFVFDVAPGATLEGVIVHGSASHTVSGLDAAIPVLYRTGASAWAGSSHSYGTVATATLLAAAERETDLALTSYLGTYESDRYTVADSAP